jgi:hypothetical protein
MWDDMLSAAYLFAMISSLAIHRSPLSHLPHPTSIQYTSYHPHFLRSIVRDHVGGPASPAPVGYQFIGGEG